MKLRIPPGCGAVSHAGQLIEIDANGCIDVGERAAAALFAHGFLPACAEKQAAPASVNQESPSDGLDRLNRRALFALLRASGVSVSLPVTNEELRTLARRTQMATPSASDDDSMKGT